MHIKSVNRSESGRKLLIRWTACLAEALEKGSRVSNLLGEETRFKRERQPHNSMSHQMEVKIIKAKNPDCKLGGPNCNGRIETYFGVLKIPCCYPCANDASDRFTFMGSI